MNCSCIFLVKHLYTRIFSHYTPSLIVQVRPVKSHLSFAKKPFSQHLSLVEHGHDGGAEEESQETPYVANEVQQVENENLLLRLQSSRGQVQGQDLVVPHVVRQGLVAQLVYELVCVEGLWNE